MSYNVAFQDHISIVLLEQVDWNSILNYSNHLWSLWTEKDFSDIGEYVAERTNNNGISEGRHLIYL